MTYPNGSVSGYLTYSFKPQLRLIGYSLEIDEMSVKDSFGGYGIGSDLVEYVKAFAKSKGFKRIILSTNRERDSYKRIFYANQGFVEKNSAWMRLDL